MRSYIDSIAAEHRPLFDRLRWLILAAHPDAGVTLPYQTPANKVGRPPPLRLRLEDAAGIPDEELRDLVRAALDA